MKLLEIGSLYGIGSEIGVTKTITRVTARLKEDSKLNALYEVLCQHLTPKCFLINHE